VTVQAMQISASRAKAAKNVTENEASIAAVSGWMLANGCVGFKVVEVVPGLFGLEIPTLEGLMLARPGDWIIRGVKGEFYPCRADIFEATYRPGEFSDEQPAGLVVSDDGELLNWQGENYVRQSTGAGRIQDLVLEFDELESEAEAGPVELGPETRALLGRIAEELRTSALITALHNGDLSAEIDTGRLRQTITARLLGSASDDTPGTSAVSARA